MTVKELKAWLATMPEGAEVEYKFLAYTYSSEFKPLPWKHLRVRVPDAIYTMPESEKVEEKEEV